MTKGVGARRDPLSGGYLSAPVSTFRSCISGKTLTLELDVAVHEPNTVHPRDCLAELAPYSSDERFVYPGEAFRIIDKIKQLATAYMLQNEAVV